MPVEELACTTGLAHPLADPLAGALHVGLVRRVSADRGDAEELRELVEPLHDASA